MSANQGPDCNWEFAQHVVDYTCFCYVAIIVGFIVFGKQQANDEIGVKFFAGDEQFPIVGHSQGVGMGVFPVFPGGKLEGEQEKFDAFVFALQSTAPGL